MRIRLYKRSSTRFKDNVPDFLLEELFQTLSPQTLASSMYESSVKEDRKSNISDNNPICYFFLFIILVNPQRRSITIIAITTYIVSPSPMFENIDNMFISVSFYDLFVPNLLIHNSISKPTLWCHVPYYTSSLFHNPYNSNSSYTYDKNAAPNKKNTNDFSCQ